MKLKIILLVAAVVAILMLAKPTRAQWTPQWIVAIGQLDVMTHPSVGVLAYQNCLTQPNTDSIVCTGQATNAIRDEATTRVTNMLHTLCDNNASLCDALFPDCECKWSDRTTPFGVVPTPPSNVPVNGPGVQPCVVPLPFGGGTRPC